MLFSHVPEGPPDPIFGALGKFNADPRSHKINLMVGTYHNEQLQKELMPSVRKAKEATLSQDLLADYLPMDGLPSLHDQLGRLLFGEKRWKAHSARIYAAQTVGGTAALRTGGEFLRQEVSPLIAMKTPTWANHYAIFERAGLQIKRMHYYDKERHGFNRERFFDELRALSPKTAVLLHASCHNPTGCDPTLDDWREISTICKRGQLLPFFDAAYQGFGAGIEEDAEVVRMFLDEGHEMLIAYSCSKNFSLYCQRVGALFVVTHDATAKTRVGSQVRRIIRATISNPPAHGARIVADVLQHHEQVWRSELDGMRTRISSMRKKLLDLLPEEFSFARAHKGMFSYLDLDAAEVQKLIDEHAIYTLDSGRINVAGLSSANIDRVASAIRDLRKS